MRDRHPGAVPDDVLADPDGPGDPVDLGRGVDTDGDGRPDTVLWTDAADLLVATDLDADGLADRVLRIGPDGSVDPGGAPDRDGPVPGSAPAAHAPWAELLGWFGP
jgi:hypothetical protein